MKILLNGATGRMGRCVAQLVARTPDCQIIAGVCRHPPRGDEGLGFPLFGDLRDLPKDAQADALIDFSSPAGAQAALLYCALHRLPCVICTTGLDRQGQRTLAFCAHETPVFYTTNLSPAAELMQELCSRAAKALGPAYTIDILEQHHSGKKDLPSGTALALAAAVDPAGCRPLCPCGQCAPQRREGEIVIHSLRCAGVVGAHQVIFSSPAERVCISHTVFQREAFAAGAVAAARFLIDKKPGLYQMKELMKR